MECDHDGFVTSKLSNDAGCERKQTSAAAGLATSCCWFGKRFKCVSITRGHDLKNAFATVNQARVDEFFEVTDEGLGQRNPVR